MLTARKFRTIMEILAAIFTAVEWSDEEIIIKIIDNIGPQLFLWLLEQLLSVLLCIINPGVNQKEQSRMSTTVHKISCSSCSSFHTSLLAIPFNFILYFQAFIFHQFLTRERSSLHCMHCTASNCWICGRW